MDSVAFQIDQASALAPAILIAARTLVASVVAVGLLLKEMVKSEISVIGTEKDHLLQRFLLDPQLEAMTAQQAMTDRETDEIHQHGEKADPKMDHVLQSGTLLRDQLLIEHLLHQKWIINGGPE